LQNRMVPWPSG